MNEFEALNYLYNDLRLMKCLDVVEELKVKSAYECLQQALAELQAIKEAKPSEALKCLEKIGTIPMIVNEKTYDFKPIKKAIPNTYNTIKQYILKTEKLEKAIKCIENLNAYNIELKEHVFVNKLIYWKDDLMLTGYSDKSHFKVEDYGITWKEVEENEKQIHNN